jgi:hypothetical protein
MKRLLTILAAALLAFAPAAHAASPAIEQAKAEGIVGERVDGYLGFVAERVDQALVAEVEDNNIQRRNLYTQMAQQQGVSVEVVAQTAGAQQIARTPPGQWYKDETNSWVQK